MDSENSTIITSESHKYKQWIKEAMEIRQCDTDPIRGMKELCCLHTSATLSFSDHQAMGDVASVTDHMINPSHHLYRESPADKGRPQQSHDNFLMKAKSTEIF